MMSLFATNTSTGLFFDHCSALILVCRSCITCVILNNGLLQPLYDEGELVDLFTGHTTWNQYNSMLRIFKYYNFNSTIMDYERNSPFSSFQQESNISSSLWHRFSSYPSFLFSGDDYYITSGYAQCCWCELLINSSFEYKRSCSYWDNIYYFQWWNLPKC